MPHPMRPIDPRVACAQVPNTSDPDCSVAGSQAALLLASRVGVLGITDQEQGDLRLAARRGGFGLPDLPALQRRRRLTVSQAREPIGGDPRALAEASAPEVQAVMSVAAQALYRAPSVRTAAALFEVGMRSPHPLVRVAAAAGACETTRTRPELVATLREGAESSDTLVAEVARAALGAIDPDDPGLRAHEAPPDGGGTNNGHATPVPGQIRHAEAFAPVRDSDPAPPLREFGPAPPPARDSEAASGPVHDPGPASAARSVPASAAGASDPGSAARASDPATATGSSAPLESGAVITHGTWGSEGTWYQPGGDFWTRLSAERPDLRVHDPSFVWSGGYSDAARRAAGRQLLDWCVAQGLAVPDLFAHSHGATVGNLATTDGLQLNRLVYMGWPVHAEWFPDAARVGRVIDIRVNMDLVILVDRGGQRIRGAPFPVEEHVNGWFDHTSTHEPDYWDRHGLWGVV